jgi:hypothetical protein
MANGKKMDEEDTRDVFDKALDYAPVVGAGAGFLVGRRFGLKKVDRADRAYMREARQQEAREVRQRANPSQRNTDDVIVGRRRLQELEKELYRAVGPVGRNAAAGTAAGAGAGYVAGQEIKKRRN